jgi:hypothetical protein
MYAAAGLLLIELTHRFFIVWGAPVPPGADMSMHAYITRLIWAADGVPMSYLPLLDIPEFRTFPVGFHVMSALTAHSLGVSAVTGSSVVSAVSHGLVAFGLYAMLRFRHEIICSALVAVLLAGGIAGIQRMVGWGGNPTVLGLALMAPLFGLIDAARTGKVIHGVLAGICALALFLTHTLIFVQCVWVFGLVFLPDFLSWAALKRAVRPAIAFFAVFVVMGAPYLLSLDTEVSPRVIAWIEDWVRNQDSAWKGDPGNALWSVPIYLVGRMGWDVISLFLTLGAIALFVFLMRRDREQARRVELLILAVGLLVLNTHTWWLPGSYALYPERIAAMCLIPIALCWAAGFAALRARLSKSLGPLRVGVVGVLTICILSGVQTQRSYRDKIERYSLATSADMAAIIWIEENTSPEAVIGTNYGDAGLWIPALAGRKVSWPHVNVSQWAAYRPVDKVSHVFIGARPASLDTSHWSASTVEQRLPGAEVVFESGDSKVYRVDAPAWPVPGLNPFEVHD